MQKTRFRLGTAIAFLVVASSSARAQESLDIVSAANASLSVDQVLSGNSLELGHIGNSLAFTADIATDQAIALGINMTAGDFNLQQNDAVLALISDAAASEANAGTTSSQSLVGQILKAEPVSSLHNAVSVDIGATGDVAGNVGLNAASGVFNLQSNAVVIAAAPGSILAEAHANLTQHAQQNLSVHHDAVNEVNATISLDGVSGNVGINIASGVGNIQSNTLTTARPF